MAAVIASLILPVSVFAQGQQNQQGVATNPAVQEKIQQIRQQVQQVRQLGQDFREAVLNKDSAKAEELLKQLKSSYASLPDKVKDRIDERHPGTRERIQNLSKEDVMEKIEQPDIQAPQPPDQSICWAMTGTVRESFTSSGANNAIMSSVPHRTWLWPLANRSRFLTGSSTIESFT